MMKKHLVTCSVIVVLLIILKLNTASSVITKPAPKIVTPVTYVVPNLVTNTNTTEATNDYSFANEALPVNASVYRKLQTSLKKHNYKNIQSNILHAKALKLFPIIEPILKAYGIPEDFKYLPLVESGLHEGTSPKGAAGLWQFMPGTARNYGLKVNHKVDERKNIEKSTIAACRYINDLYDEFNSWTLAAAAYNNGSVKLERAINSQSEDNYFMMKLNRETGNYVYSILAMKEIIVKPRKYGYSEYYTYVKFQPKNFIAYN
ncbi:lytic transglycosylase domain-containing protein [Mucilaginibacter calamicampi]|uniref:Lytic transglycosylase domain-containing protein n=1 Tax=Mucilaginibacter calamicampi TaxID=1302352 RepID=A0ABW2YX49_9SPHI